MTDSAGSALAGARVILFGRDDQPPKITFTGNDGAYSFAGIKPGIYSLSVEPSGFREPMRSKVKFDGKHSVTEDFSLARRGKGPKAANTQFPSTGTSRKAKSASGAVGNFSFYDKPEFKPGAMNAGSDRGGYSSSAHADSYDLILSYIGRELPTPQLMAGPGNASRMSAPAPSAPRLNESQTRSWTESQFLSRGSDQLLRRQFDQAKQIFQLGIARFPNSAKLQAGLGVTLYAIGDFDPAVEALIRATDLMPSDPRLYLLLGKAYAGATTPSSETTQRLARLVELEPRSGQARYYYALSLLKTAPASDASLTKAETLLKSAVALDPKLAEAHLELGVVYAWKSNYPMAIEEYRECIRLSPNLAAAHYRLAQAYTRTGNKTMARVELSRYLQLKKR